MELVKCIRVARWIAASLLATVWIGLLLCCPNVQAHTHGWIGLSGNGLWSSDLNWEFNPVYGRVPEGGSDCTVAFDSATAPRAATNDLAAGHYYYELYFGREGGYKLYGNEVVLDWLTGDFAAGTNCTVYLDIHPQHPGPLDIEVVTNNSTLVIAGDLVRSGANSNVNIRVTGAGDLTLSGVISGEGNLYKNSSGDLTMQGSLANTFTGKTYANEGILRLSKTAVVPPGIVVGRVSIPGDLTIGEGTSGPVGDIVWLGYHNQIADTSAATINGSGQLDLNDHNDTIGALTMTAGSIVTGTGMLTLNGNVSCDPGSSASVISGKLALGSGTVRNFAVSTGAQMRVDAVVSGGSGIDLWKWLEGELILAAANTYDCPTMLGGGTLTLLHPQALGSSTQSAVLYGGTLQLDAVSVSNKVLAVMGSSTLKGNGTCGWWGDTTLGGPLVVDAASGATLTLGGVLSGSGFITKTNTGTLRLSGTSPNTFSGNCHVNAGTLELGKTAGPAIRGSLVVGDGSGGPNADVVRLTAAHQLSATNYVSVTASGWLDLNGYDDIIGGLSNSGRVSLGAGRLTVSNELSDCVFSGVITGSTGGLTKSGAGMMTLSGTNKYSGTTAISNGTLCVNGVISNSPVSLYASGSTLSGTGIVSSITANQGVLRPGSSAGILTSLGNATLNPGTLEIELNGTNVGTDYDQLRALIGVALGTTSTLTVTCNFAAPAGATFKIIDNAGSKAVLGTFSGLPEGTVFAASGLPFHISYVGGDGNDVVLTRVQSPAVTNAIALLTNSQVRLSAQGIAGVNYVIEAAPNLSPSPTWAPISTNPASGSGLIEFIEPDLSLYAQRFYRIASP